MHAPTWGNFIGHGDKDVLAFAWLLQGGLFVTGYYHATQALEKYLKALALSIVDPPGTTHPSQHRRWLNDHNLARLAGRCTSQYPYYGEAKIQAALARFTEFDQAARYPYVERTLGNSFDGCDLPLICELLIHLRRDIPIIIDDYPLGMLLRGHHQNHPEYADSAPYVALHASAVAAARRVIPNIEQMVRW
jgi:HEPN domain-containing protein